MLKTRHTPNFLKAVAQGAEIRERLSYKSATHRPRTAGDPRPWVIYDEGLEQEFRPFGRELMIVWPDGRWTDSQGAAIPKRFEYSQAA
ncbi:hypothetical protein AB0F36_07985 [Streptomyces sp. NPDC029080]|uniref:hypothetical protein n=1 Tax=Streptomyces sp. NPDC029080 TaxID=3155017 RepID=UPI0033D162C9